MQFQFHLMYGAVNLIRHMFKTAAVSSFAVWRLYLHLLSFCIRDFSKQKILVLNYFYFIFNFAKSIKRSLKLLRSLKVWEIFKEFFVKVL